MREKPGGVGSTFQAESLLPTNNTLIAVSLKENYCKGYAIKSLFWLNH